MTLRVIMIKPLKSPEIKDIDGSLEGMQEIVGGDIELYCPFEDGTIGIIVNEEGKILGLPENRMVSDNGKIIDILCGPAFIVNLDSDDGEFVSLTDEQIKCLMPRIGKYTIYC